MADRDDQAFVLHLRPYRESSALVDFFTAATGRVAAVARGVRGARSGLRGSKGGNALACFVRYEIKFKGDGELKSLVKAEPVESRWLTGAAAACGLYLNELLTRLTARDDPHPEIFARYGATIDLLARLGAAASDAADVDGAAEQSQQNGALEATLRRFERHLLADLGYGVEFEQACDTHLPIRASDYYRLHQGQGFVSSREARIPGVVLLAMARDDYAEPQTRRWAKSIMRRLIAAHLAQPLRSAELLPANPRSF